MAEIPKAHMSASRRSLGQTKAQLYFYRSSYFRFCLLRLHSLRHTLHRRRYLRKQFLSTTQSCCLFLLIRVAALLLLLLLLFYYYYHHHHYCYSLPYSPVFVFVPFVIVAFFFFPPPPSLEITSGAIQCGVPTNVFARSLLAFLQLRQRRQNQPVSLLHLS